MSISKKALSFSGPVLVDIQFDDLNETWKDGWYIAQPK